MCPGKAAVFGPVRRLFSPLGSRSLRRVIPNRCNQRETVLTAQVCLWMASSWVILHAEHLFCRRQVSISSITSTGSRVGRVVGTLEWSSRAWGHRGGSGPPIS